MPTTREIAWLAGLLEGEGCFDMDKRSPRIQLRMTDRDVVVEAARLLERKLCGPYLHRVLRQDGNPRKVTYSVNVLGSHAAAWMMTLYSLMGTRRQAAIRVCLGVWKCNRQFLPRGDVLELLAA